MKTVRYILPVTDPKVGETVCHSLIIEGTRKERRRKFAMYVKEAYGITNARGLARKMGFRDLL